MSASKARLLPPVPRRQAGSWAALGDRSPQSSVRAPVLTPCPGSLCRVGCGSGSVVAVTLSLVVLGGSPQPEKPALSFAPGSGDTVGSGPQRSGFLLSLTSSADPERPVALAVPQPQLGKSSNTCRPSVALGEQGSERGVPGPVLSPQEDMRAALDEGQSLLQSVREPLAKGGGRSLSQDQLDNQTTVQR